MLSTVFVKFYIDPGMKWKMEIQKNSTAALIPRVINVMYSIVENFFLLQKFSFLLAMHFKKYHPLPRHQPYCDVMKEKKGLQKKRSWRFSVNNLSARNENITLKQLDGILVHVWRFSFSFAALHGMRTFLSLLFFRLVVRKEDYVKANSYAETRAEL